MTFHDRTDAGQQLATALHRYRGKDAVVLALPRGGLPVAMPVAATLQLPLGLLLVRKIGVPFQPEVAMGAVVDGAEPIVVRNEDVIASAGIDHATFDAAKNRELKELERRRALYHIARSTPDIAGRIAIIVDDGLATGATARAAIQAVRLNAPASIVLAVPVAPRDQIIALSKLADDFVCLEELGPVGAISMHYLHFAQLTDGDMAALLHSCGLAEPSADMSSDRSR
ncbi:MAG TPA: phosphoribosyltransferase family protein [Ensifer sp.]|nr:phosphoribosyltransferase family protein [Ensifer sp.]